jgi:hypothetical protein
MKDLDPIGKMMPKPPAPVPTRTRTPRPKAMPPPETPSTFILPDMPKPALESRTVKSGLAVLIIALWPVLITMIAFALSLAGVQLDAEPLKGLASDGAITGGDIFTVVYHTALAVLGALVVKFRIETKDRIQSLFSKKD